MIRAAFLVVLVLLDARGFYLVGARRGHAGSNYARRGDCCPGRFELGRLVAVPGSPKSADLAALVDRLRGDLGDDYFVEVPHWDGDPAAIGLGNPADPRFLVYLSVQPGETAAYLECEVPAGQDASDVPYDVASSGVYTDYKQILTVIQNHLAR